MHLVDAISLEVKELDPGHIEVFIGGRISPIGLGLIPDQGSLGDDHITLLIKPLVAGSKVGNGFQNPDIEFTQRIPPVEDGGDGEVVVDDVLGMTIQKILQSKGSFPDLPILFKPFLHVRWGHKYLSSFRRFR